MIAGFDVANEYANKFELFQEFFAENESLDLEVLQEDQGRPRWAPRYSALCFFPQVWHSIDRGCTATVCSTPRLSSVRYRKTWGS